MNEIYDKDKKQWLRIDRSFLGNLRFTKLHYTQLTRFPVNGDFTYSDCDGLKILNIPRPKIPE
jgi:hypothetical protein